MTMTMMLLANLYNPLELVLLDECKGPKDECRYSD